MSGGPESRTSSCGKSTSPWSRRKFLAATGRRQRRHQRKRRPEARQLSKEQAISSPWRASLAIVVVAERNERTALICRPPIERAGQQYPLLLPNWDPSALSTLTLNGRGDDTSDRCEEVSEEGERARDSAVTAASGAVFAMSRPALVSPAPSEQVRLLCDALWPPRTVLVSIVLLWLSAVAIAPHTHASIES